MKNIRFSDFQYKLILFLIQFIIFIMNRWMDNDFWFTINQGKYIIENGFPTKVLFTVHENLDFIYQSWGTGVTFYAIYNSFGDIGINILLVVIGWLTIYFFYKLCYEVSKKRELSYFVTIITMIMYVSIYLVTRPHIFTSLNLIILLYLLEKYVNTNNKKYLIPLPFLSLLEVNMHGMYFFILLIYTLPYLVDSFKIKFLNMESSNFDRRYLLIAFILMFICGFINPYTYKTVMYVFSSFGNQLLKTTITELRPLNINDHSFPILTIFIVLLLYYFNKNKKVKIRYLLLVLGSTILALESLKSFNFFLLGAIFPLTFVLKGNFSEIANQHHKLSYYIINSSLSVLLVILIILNYSPKKLTDNKAMNYLKTNYSTDNNTVYTEFMEGSYIEYLGFKCYIDPRAEVFLKQNNHKKDIYNEYIKLTSRNLDYKEFLQDYDFNLLFINKESTMYELLKKDCLSYKLVYNDSQYQIYEKSE